MLKMKTMKERHTYIVIMAGGAGTRFWPSSTEERPKQFLDILGTGKRRVENDKTIVLTPHT